MKVKLIFFNVHFFPYFIYKNRAKVDIKKNQFQFYIIYKIKYMRKQIQVPLGTFSKNLDEELQARMEIGIVDFNFVITTDSAAEPKGSTRHARGTRNLSFDFIPFDAIPMGLRTPPDWVCTFYDVDRGGWRCFVRSALINISDKIEIEE